MHENLVHLKFHALFISVYKRIYMQYHMNYLLVLHTFVFFRLINNYVCYIIMIRHFVVGTLFLFQIIPFTFFAVCQYGIRVFYIVTCVCHVVMSQQVGQNPFSILTMLKRHRKHLFYSGHGHYYSWNMRT